MTKKRSLLFLLERFFDIYLPKTRGLSGNTVRAYRDAFRLLFTYMATERDTPPERVSLSGLRKDVIEEWLAWLEESRGCTAKTRNHRLAALVTFARFAIQEDFDYAMAFCSAIERIPRKRHPKQTAPIHLSREEMTILLRLPDSTSKIGQRDKVVLSTLYATGARAQEICDLKVGDVRFGKTMTVTLHGKGGKTRTVIIPQQCARLLRSYIEHSLGTGLAGNNGVFMFSSQTHRHMTVSCVEAIVKKYIKQAKALRPDLFRNNYTPHSFRHSISMHMLESGIPLPVIKTFLGHVSISSTLVYASADFEMVSRYLRDKDPYAEQENEEIKESMPALPSFLL
jgi:site-specific recombinase XerD